MFRSFKMMSSGASLLGLLCAAIAGQCLQGVPSAQAQGKVPGQTKPATVSAAGITLHSVSVELPSSDRMFPGDAKAEAINNNCLACHSAGMVLNQPAMTQAAWQQEVAKMRSQYKAPVDEADIPAIVAYLAAHKGTP